MRSLSGRTTSYAERTSGRGGGSWTLETAIGANWWLVDGLPTGSTTIGTRGARLIAAVVSPQGASHIQAQPSNAIPIGPTAAHRMTNAKINRRRGVDIDEIIAWAYSAFGS